ncbi:unnamed protein product [Protopolystoma xenopodis]|uniref:Uncharacterized protein n=1 Tax=Protopolystoma xenopodis TaxID=117903 RepID=A0A3S5A2P1_9PLAT|nr:unnamed protein product [Protopolystoma xenopodis]
MILFAISPLPKVVETTAAVEVCLPDSVLVVHFQLRSWIYSIECC